VPNPSILEIEIDEQVVIGPVARIQAEFRAISDEVDSAYAEMEAYSGRWQGVVYPRPQGDDLEDPRLYAQTHVEDGVAGHEARKVEYVSVVEGENEGIYYLPQTPEGGRPTETEIEATIDRIVGGNSGIGIDEIRGARVGRHESGTVDVMADQAGRKFAVPCPTKAGVEADARGERERTGEDGRKIGCESYRLENAHALDDIASYEALGGCARGKLLVMSQVETYRIAAGKENVFFHRGYDRRGAGYVDGHARLVEEAEAEPAAGEAESHGALDVHSGVDLVIVRGEEIGDRGRARSANEEIGDIENRPYRLYSEIGCRELARHVREACGVAEEDGKIIGEGGVGAAHGLVSSRGEIEGLERIGRSSKCGKRCEKYDGQRKATMHSLPLFSVL
jgi:hypothetical protein